MNLKDKSLKAIPSMSFVTNLMVKYRKIVDNGKVQQRHRSAWYITAFGSLEAQVIGNSVEGDSRTSISPSLRTTR